MPQLFCYMYANSDYHVWHRQYHLGNTTDGVLAMTEYMQPELEAMTTQFELVNEDPHAINIKVNITRGVLEF